MPALSQASTVAQSWAQIGSGTDDWTGRGDDFTFGDYRNRDPDIPASEEVVPWWLHSIPGFGVLNFGRTYARAALGLYDPRAMYQRLVRMSSGDLETIFRNWFRGQPLNTGPLGQRMIGHFMSGAGETMVHPHGSELSRDMMRTNTFRDGASRLTTALQDQVRRYGGIGLGSDGIKYDFDFRTGSRDPTYTFKLRALVGGIKFGRYYLRGLRRSQGRYTAQLRVELTDNFGVSVADMYQEGMIALWILQHQRRGRPYVLRIEMDSQITF